MRRWRIRPCLVRRAVGRGRRPPAHPASTTPLACPGHFRGRGAGVASRFPVLASASRQGRPPSERRGTYRPVRAPVRCPVRRLPRSPRRHVMTNRLHGDDPEPDEPVLAGRVLYVPVRPGPASCAVRTFRTRWSPWPTGGRGCWYGASRWTTSAAATSGCSHGGPVTAWSGRRPRAALACGGESGEGGRRCPTGTARSRHRPDLRQNTVDVVGWGVGVAPTRGVGDRGGTRSRRPLRPDPPGSCPHVRCGVHRPDHRRVRRHRRGRERGRPAVSADNLVGLIVAATLL